MTHIAKFDWWSIAAIVFGFLVILAGCNYWIAGPVMLVLALSAYPQSYVTTSSGLLVRAGLMRRLIPYQTITVVEPVADDTIKVQYGHNSLLLEPEDPDAFFRDLANRVPHLGRRVQFSF
jgi:Bacterial PH domain